MLQQQKQQQQQASRADVLRDACRVPPLWRTHHIFSSTVTDPCPQQLVQGSWMNAAKENGVGGVLPYTAQVSSLQERFQKDVSAAQAHCSKSLPCIHLTVLVNTAGLLLILCRDLFVAEDL